MAGLKGYNLRSRSEAYGNYSETVGAQDSKAATTPGTCEERKTQPTHDERSDDDHSSKYRAPVARCNHLSPDRPDISYSANELARHMANATQGNWSQLKRLGRYLKGRPRLQQVFKWQEAPDRLKVRSDADWAGCREIRRSTIGGCILLGNHTLKGLSKTQPLVAPSSGESHLYATLKFEEIWG